VSQRFRSFAKNIYGGGFASIEHFPFSSSAIPNSLNVMTDDDVHQSHDKLFKVGFSDLANAAALLPILTKVPSSLKLKK